nr:ribonuclease H-like domain-containing protein [Tanacetum cinerariifolium]
MDQDSANMVAASKVPMLKVGEYELWRMRMEQYIQMVDYSLWDVIENGNAPPITQFIEGVKTIIALATTEEKAQRRFELKARSTLLMGIPNEHQLKFKFIKDAKSLLQAIKKRFRGNVATKKTQKNLLKQQYENFTASSSEVLDQIFNRLQKLISQLEIHGESISQEDVNQKFLRKEMDLRWQMAMLTMRARRLLKNIGRKFSMNGNETIRFNNSKVEYYNCHKRRHFARECIAPRIQYTKHKESTRRTVKRLGGYDLSDQAEDGPTNFALMAYSSTSSNSEVSTDSNYSSSCLENTRMLKEQNEQLLKDLRTSKINFITYKTGLESVEVRLLVYKKNKSVYEEDIKLLKYSEDEAELKPKIEKKTVKPSFPKIEFVKSKGHVKSPRKTTVKQIMKKLMEDMLPLEVTPKEGKSQAELIDETYVLPKVPRKNNMYSVDLKNIVPKEGLTFLFAKATSDESKLWRKRLGHLNFKTMNKLVKGNLVRDLPSNFFENIQDCIACKKGKQHRPSCKSKTKNSISQPLHLLYMDLFGPTFVKSLMKKMYCLVVTDDYSSGPNWLFDIDALTKSKNYKPVVAGNQSNGNAGTKACDDTSKATMETVPGKDYILLPLWTAA